jgi:hypothetical protein
LLVEQEFLDDEDFQRRVVEFFFDKTTRSQMQAIETAVAYAQKRHAECQAKKAA